MAIKSFKIKESKTKVAPKLNRSADAKKLVRKVPDVRQNRFGPFGTTKAKIAAFKKKQSDNLRPKK